jgi:hypothetical protein
VTDYDLFRSEQRNPFAGELERHYQNSENTLGIVKDLLHNHKYYIKACQELGISYQVVDISSTDWINTLNELKCDAYLLWPSVRLSIWRDMFLDRVKIMEVDMNKLVYPTWREVWVYESKLRMHYWLTANNLPQPQTWVFYGQDEALDFAKTCELPVVMKTNVGAAAKGVFILKNRHDVIKATNRVFKKSIRLREHDPRDHQWGHILFQEYLPDVKEWRMVRIGDSYFGHPKIRAGDFHSGSGKFGWDVPEPRHLDFLRTITDNGKFTSMNVDMFETQQGQLLVNELQTVFSAVYSVDQLRVDGKPGRFIRDPQDQTWIFEEGDFARNACANARIDYLVNTILEQRKRHNE